METMSSKAYSWFASIVPITAGIRNARSTYFDSSSSNLPRGKASSSVDVCTVRRVPSGNSSGSFGISVMTPICWAETKWMKKL